MPKLIDRIRDRPDFALLQTVLLRSLSQAQYSPDNVGHFGLAYDAYAHFTSPIRRYPDLLVHRAIKAVLAGKRYMPKDATWEELGVHCSLTERRADDASRDVLQWLKCHYMKEKVGETFAGTISGVASFGIFVTLDGLDIDGLVHVTELPRDYFHFDAVRHALIGERSGRTFQLAGRVTVKVARVDLERAKIDFTLDESGGVQSARIGAAFSPADCRGAHAHRPPAARAQVQVAPVIDRPRKTPGRCRRRAADCDLVLQAPFLLREDLRYPAADDGRRSASSRSSGRNPTPIAFTSRGTSPASPKRASRPATTGRSCRASARWIACGSSAMDMDSTLITIECIDEIAALKGIGGEVAAITAAAMRGEIDFRESLARRVALLAGLPIAALERVYDERLRLSPGAERMLDDVAQASARRRCWSPAASRSSPTACRRDSRSTTRCPTRSRSQTGG